MLAPMTSAAELLLAARESVGLSQRALAARAGVPASTVLRIENGHMDPTVGMLRRLLEAADTRLELGAAPLRRRPELTQLSAAWKRAADGDRPDWTPIRAVLDTLARHPEWTADAIARQPQRSGSAVMDALLAGIAEKLADDAGLPRPAWTRRGRRLKQQWTTPGPARHMAWRQAHTPPQLKERNVIVDAQSLWRERVPSDG